SGGLEAPAAMQDFRRGREDLELIGQLGADDGHPGPGLQEPVGLLRRFITAAHHEARPILHVKIDLETEFHRGRIIPRRQDAGKYVVPLRGLGYNLAAMSPEES